MTGLRIIFDDGEARLVLDKAIANTRNLGPVMAAIAGEVDDRVQESFQNKIDPVVTDADDHGVTTRTRGVEYALIHFTGAPSANIPARRFAGISEDDTQQFADMIRDLILRG